MAGGKRENKSCVLPAGFGQCRSGEKVGQKTPSESGCKHMKPSAHRVLTGNSCFYSILFFFFLKTITSRNTHRKNNCPQLEWVRKTRRFRWLRDTKGNMDIFLLTHIFALNGIKAALQPGIKKNNKKSVLWMTSLIVNRQKRQSINVLGLSVCIRLNLWTWSHVIGIIKQVMLIKLCLSVCL